MNVVFKNYRGNLKVNLVFDLIYQNVENHKNNNNKQEILKISRKEVLES